MTCDALSCSVRFNHVVIVYYENFKLYLWILNPMHLSATLELHSLSSEMVGSSEYLCSAGGKFCNHSTEFLVCVGNKISRFDVILSHMTNKNIITLTNEMVL
jgi:hypothetical protein